MSDCRSKTNLLDRRGRCLDDPGKDECIHKWEPTDFNRKLECLFCGEVISAASAAPLHHRSCHLRKGGNYCTC